MSNKKIKVDREFMTFNLEKCENGNNVLKGDCWQGNHFKTVIIIKYVFSTGITKVTEVQSTEIQSIDLLTKYRCCQKAVEEAVKYKLLE